MFLAALGVWAAFVWLPLWLAIILAVCVTFDLLAVMVG